MTTKENLIQQIQADIDVRVERLNKIKAIEGLNALDVDAALHGINVDFDNLSHDKVIEVIKALNAGRWNKTPGDNATVHYESIINGVTFRIWRGEPPPNCKIVEVLETVPAQPERVVTKRKLVCQ